MTFSIIASPNSAPRRPLRHNCECAAGGLNRLVDDFFRMRDADKARLELRRREIDSLVEQRVEKPWHKVPGCSCSLSPNS